MIPFEGEAPRRLIRVVPADLKSQSSPLLGTAPSAEIRAQTLSEKGQQQQEQKKAACLGEGYEE